MGYFFTSVKILLTINGILLKNKEIVIVDQWSRLFWPTSVSFSLFFSKILHWENSFFDMRSKQKFLSTKDSFVKPKKFSFIQGKNLFTLKKFFLNQGNFLQFKETFSLTIYQRNVSLIQRNCFLGVIVNKMFYGDFFWFHRGENGALKLSLARTFPRKICYLLNHERC